MTKKKESFKGKHRLEAVSELISLGFDNAEEMADTYMIVRKAMYDKYYRDNQERLKIKYFNK